MAEKLCDHTSVGMLAWNDDSLLLIERAKFPFGLAPPAGHIDGDKSPETAAARELGEEVGLTAKALKLVLDKEIQNPCRRIDGTWHHWRVYEVQASGDVRRSLDETKAAGWYPRSKLQKLADRTRGYLSEDISEQDWQARPGLEPVWTDILRELGIIT